MNVTLSEPARLTCRHYLEWIIRDEREISRSTCKLYICENDHGTNITCEVEARFLLIIRDNYSLWKENNLLTVERKQIEFFILIYFKLGKLLFDMVAHNHSKASLFYLFLISSIKKRNKSKTFPLLYAVYIRNFPIFGVKNIAVKPTIKFPLR